MRVVAVAGGVVVGNSQLITKLRRYCCGCVTIHVVCYFVVGCGLYVCGSSVVCRPCARSAGVSVSPVDCSTGGTVPVDRTRYLWLHPCAVVQARMSLICDSSGIALLLPLGRCCFKFVGSRNRGLGVE